MKMKEFGPPGWRTSLAPPPLDSPMEILDPPLIGFFPYGNQWCKGQVTHFFFRKKKSCLWPWWRWQASARPRLIETFCRCAVLCMLCVITSQVTTAPSPWIQENWTTHTGFLQHHGISFISDFPEKYMKAFIYSLPETISLPRNYVWQTWIKRNSITICRQSSESDCVGDAWISSGQNHWVRLLCNS